MVHSTWPSRAMLHMHAPTLNKWHKTNKNKNKTLHILIHGAMHNVRVWVDFFGICINDKICDTRERNVPIKSEIWTTNIRSLGFWDIREWVTLRKLILWSLGCTPPYGVQWKFVPTSLFLVYERINLDKLTQGL